MTIENPFNEFLLAGFLSALYECAEGVVPEVDWERVDGQTLGSPWSRHDHVVPHTLARETQS